VKTSDDLERLFKFYLLLSSTIELVWSGPSGIRRPWFFTPG